MNCVEIKINLHDFVDELIDDEGKKEIENHLKTCNSCFAEYKRIRKFFDKLKNIPYTIDPPATIIEQLSAELLKRAAADVKEELSKPQINIKKIKREQIKQEKELQKVRGVIRKSNVTRSIFTTKLTRPLPSRYSLSLTKTIWTLLPIVLIAVGYFIYDFMLINSPWKVRTVAGSVAINGQISLSERWDEGENLAIDEFSKVVINIPKTGRLEVEPNSFLILLKAKDKSNRIKLLRGAIQVINTSLMPYLTIELNDAVIHDRGGTFNLLIDDNSNAKVYVEYGYLEIEQKGRTYFLDEGYICELRTSMHPGTPYRADASEILKSEVAKFDYENGGDTSIGKIISNARESDLLTLLALIPRSAESYRSILFNKITAYYPPPPGVTQEGIIKLDRDMLERWWFEIEWQI
ncbi:MAG: zf-HC2 domain-containing protein [Melioribacteraceae bacterium]|nr:zf-HC2 domain-containing protein [Melioribacteraceae bacterium]